MVHCQRAASLVMPCHQYDWLIFIQSSCSGKILCLSLLFAVCHFCLMSSFALHIKVEPATFHSFCFVLYFIQGVSKRALQL